MFPLPILCAILQTVDAGESLVYLIGAFFLLFADQIEQLSDWISNLPGIWSDIVGWTILGSMILMWAAIWFLPFFGLWHKRVAVLWFAQFSYSAAQAICGWFFVLEYA